MLRGLKHLLFAVLLLAATLCALEVGLRGRRFYQATYGDLAATDDGTPPLLPSWNTFQQLRPLSKYRAVNPGTGESVPIRINSLGLRGPEVIVPKPAGVFRVICLGDDTTLAAEVLEDETYCDRLRARLQERTQLEVEVVNAGVPGGCALISLLYLRHHLSGTQPDLVLVHCEPTDVAPDRRVRPYTMVDAAGMPICAVHPTCGGPGALPLEQLAAEFLVVELAQSRLGKYWEQRTARQRSPDDDLRDRSQTDSANDALYLDQALAPLAQIKQLAAGLYCDAIVSSCPDFERLSLTEAGGAVTDHRSVTDGDPFHALAEYVQKESLPLIDATPHFRAARSRDALDLERSGRLSAEGHDLYAAVLAEFVVRNVPGVWSALPAPTSTPDFEPLPDVARAPRAGP